MAEMRSARIEVVAIVHFPTMLLADPPEDAVLTAMAESRHPLLVQLGASIDRGQRGAADYYEALKDGDVPMWAVVVYGVGSAATGLGDAFDSALRDGMAKLTAKGSGDGQ